MIKNTGIMYVFFAILLFLQVSSVWAQGYLIQTDDPEAARTQLLENAEYYLGAPYVYTGTSRSGVDCSGLVFAVCRDAFRTRLPRGVNAIYSAAVRIDRNDLTPGDLVFFNTTGSMSHVGIYIGDSQFIHAASAGPRIGVIISSLQERYYAQRVCGFARILPPVPVLSAGAGESEPNQGAVDETRGEPEGQVSESSDPIAPDSQEADESHNESAETEEDGEERGGDRLQNLVDDGFWD
ncbi:MAG: C40 family peptidase [Spirochaetia bacterium]